MNNDSSTDNATKKCNTCKADIPHDAKKCQHCRAIQPLKLTKKSGGCLLAIFVLFILALGGCSSDETTVDTIKVLDNQIEVGIIAATFAGYVADPDGSADDSAPQRVLDLGENKWEVTSYFIDQTEFGDTVRTDWSATIQYEGGDWYDLQSWTLHELILDGEVMYTSEIE